MGGGDVAAAMLQRRGTKKSLMSLSFPPHPGLLLPPLWNPTVSQREEILGAQVRCLPPPAQWDTGLGRVWG